MANLPPQVRLYLHMLGGSGKPMRLPPGLRNAKFPADPNTTLARIATNTNDYMYNPENNAFAYPLQSAYSLGAEPDEFKPFDGSVDRGWAQSLGSFQARPVGKDSVAIKDRYDFHKDLGMNGGQLQALIRFANLFGRPFDIRDTLYAPDARSVIDSTRAVRETWRKNYLKASGE